MDHDDTSPMADLSPTDSETGTEISPWVVVGVVALLLALVTALVLLL